jgi:hypothetical protein
MLRVVCLIPATGSVQGVVGLVMDQFVDKKSLMTRA